MISMMKNGMSRTAQSAKADGPFTAPLIEQLLPPPPLRPDLVVPTASFE
jgi:hypothetical protein